MAFMVHPEHGATNVNSGEVPALEKLGWKVSTHEEWLAPKLKAIEAAKAPQVDSEVEKIRKELDDYGVPYDKRWGVAKLREALDEALS